MNARDYQIETVRSIELHKRNLVVLPMRAGKSYTCKLIIDHYDFKKVLIITGFRKIVLQFESYFPDESTYILSGMDYDHTARVTLASFQTYNRRDIDTAEFDAIFVDEYHSRMSKSVEQFIAKATGTVILLTGTPLSASNRIITKNIDNYIQPITVLEMMEAGYLAPTKFMSNRNILGDNASKLKTNRSDYSEADVLQVVQKSHLLDDIVRLVEKDSLATEHKTLIYVNFISTAIELYDMLSPIYENTYILHSKMSEKDQTATLDMYQSVSHGLIISVRSLSLGFDSPTSDRLIFALLTKRHALALQILWRSSTLDPANPQKQSVVYDMIGQLVSVNPYTDFSEYSKKLTCQDECDSYTDLFTRWACHESCKGQPPMHTCDGQLSYSLQENPHISNFTIHEGIPCMEAVPTHKMKYQTIDIGHGRLQKYSRCTCGCLTSYTLKTMMEPSEMIEVYHTEEIPTSRNTAILLYDKPNRTIVGIFDKVDKPNYIVKTFSSSKDLLEYTTALFKSPYMIVCNRTISSIPELTVLPELMYYIPLIDWSLKSQDGIVRKILKFKLDVACEAFQIKPGFAYYFMKNVDKSNEKQIMELLSRSDLERSHIMYRHKQLDKKE